VRLADIRVGNWSIDGSDKKDTEREAAKNYLNRTILQRDIVLEITSTGQQQQSGRRNKGRQRGRGRGGKNVQGTRNPNLDGHIYYKGKNVAEHLLENGWASVIKRRYEQQNRRSSTPKLFLDLEKKAQEKKLGIWKNIDEDIDDAKMNDAAKEQRRKNSKTGKDVEVVVSHIESATLFYVNMADSDEMQKMNAEMEKLAKNPKVPKVIRAGKAVRYAAKYDGYYARARVNNRDKRERMDADKDKESESNWFVLFIDYGNKASISRKQFAELPEALRLDRIPKLSFRCELAGISVYRKNERAYNNAGYFFSSHAFQYENQKLKMKVLYDDQYYNTWYVELFIGDKSINQLIAREGYVTLIKDRDLPRAFSDKSENGQEWSEAHKLYVKQYFDAIKANITLAKDEHKNIWYHGDVDSAEEDNFPDSGGRKKRR